MSLRVILFLGVAFISLAWSFKRPKVGIFFFIFLLFLRDGYFMEQLPEIYTNWHLPLITGWIVLVSWFWSNIHKNEHIAKPAAFIVLALLAFVIFASKRNAYVPDKTIGRFEDYLRMVILVFLIINTIKNKIALRQISYVLVGTMTFLTAYAYYRYKVEGLSIAVPSLYYVDRNYFAASIVAVLPLAFYFYESAKRIFIKYFFLGIVALFSAGVILTDSRGGFLALSIVLCTLFMQSKKKLEMLTMGVIILALFLPHIGEQYKDRLGTVQTYEEDASAMTRIATWKAAINMIKERPFLGIGAGNFNYVYPYYVPPEYSKYSGFISIHNMFLQILSETGLIGGGLYILAMLLCFKDVYKLNKKNKRLPLKKRIDLSYPNTLRASMIGFAGAGFFLPGVYESYMFIICALVLVSYRIYNTEIEKTIKLVRVNSKK